MRLISNFYIPINFSDLSKIIPKGDNILYSTLCNAKRKFPEKKEWNSHVLFTNSGIGYCIGSLEDDQTELKFTTWIDIHDSKAAQFKKKQIYFDSTWFSVIRDEAYESEKDFKTRAKSFGNFCQSLYRASKSDYIKYFIKKTSNYYVPVESSNLYKYFPERDKILYSTLCEVLNKRPDYRPHGGTIKKRWLSHVLISKSGFGFIEYQRNSCIFKYWREMPPIKIKNPDRIKIFKLPGVWKNSTTFFTASLDNRYETNENFSLRLKDFANFCTAIQEDYRLYYNEMVNYTENISEKFTRDGLSGFLDKVVPFMLSGYIEKALAILEEVLKVIPEQNSDDIWYYKGEALRLLYRDKEALNSYETSLRINPQNIRAKDKKDELQLKINLDSISSKDKNKAYKLHYKGVKRFKKKRNIEALELFEEALKINPYDTRTWIMKGLNFEALNKLEEATKCYQEALKINPKESDAAENLRKLKSS